MKYIGLILCLASFSLTANANPNKAKRAVLAMEKINGYSKVRAKLVETTPSEVGVKYKFETYTGIGGAIYNVHAIDDNIVNVDQQEEIDR